MKNSFNSTNASQGAAPATEPQVGGSRQAELSDLEARAAASLSHDNILKSAQAEATNGATGEKAGLETLHEYLKRRGWLSADETLRITQQIAGALEHAHRLGVLHLALDPGKILLDREGSVFVTGFGIESAREMAWAHQERSRHCSARYISPEQVLGRGMDERTDLYLLGIMMYEMLTDRAPFEAEDEVSLRLKHLSKPPQPPHMFRPELSRAVSQIVIDLLSKKPDRRPNTISVLRSTLEQCAVAGLVADEVEVEEPIEGVIEEVSEEEVEPSLFSETDDELATVEQASPVSEAYAPILVAEEEPDAIDEPPRKPVTFGPVFASLENRGHGSRRLAWLLLLIVILGSLVFWLMSASRFPDDRKTIGSSVVAETLPDAGPAPSNARVIEPEKAQEVAPAAEAPSSKPKPATSTAERRIELPAPKESAQAGDDSEKVVSPPERSIVAPPPVSPVETNTKGQISLPDDLKSSVSGNTRSDDPPPAPEQPVQDGSPGPKVIRRSGDVLQNTAIFRSDPVYPDEARKAEIRGPVTVEVTIDEEGSVIAARAISGPRQLHNAAVAAARRWKWLPAKVDRNRARVVGTITLSFRK